MNPEGYRNERMNLQDVQAWLENKGMRWVGKVVYDAFKDHVWTVDGLTRTDVIKDIFSKIDETGLLFREMECDVITYMGVTPIYEAHVD